MVKELKTDTNIQTVEQLAEATSNMYMPLVKGLKRITGENGWFVLNDMTYNSYAEKQLPLGVQKFDVCPLNFIKSNSSAEEYVCACGKPHISKLTIMDYDHIYDGIQYQYIILGSECIQTTAKFLLQINGITDFKKKINMWSSIIKKEARKYKFNSCFCCETRAVSKTTLYKKKQRKYWCKDCCSLGGKVKCIECGYLRFYMISPTTREPMLYCRDCFYDHNIDKISFTQKKLQCSSVSS
tara:strand:+ start:1585 stop:2304 length:720 start_codon:yes stop_codon:yes gene_type:complete